MRDLGPIKGKPGNSLGYDCISATITYRRRKGKAKESCDSPLKTNFLLDQSLKMAQSGTIYLLYWFRLVVYSVIGLIPERV